MRANTVSTLIINMITRTDVILLMSQGDQMMANPTPSQASALLVSGAPDANTTKRLKMPIAAEAKAKGPTIEIVLMYFEPKSTCTTRLEKTVSVQRSNADKCVI